MLLFEAFIKFATVGLLIGVGLLLLRDGRKTPALRLALPLVLAMCFMFITTGSESLSITGPWAIPLRLFDSLNIIFVWWLGLSLFDDNFKLGKREWLITGLFAALVIPVRLHYLGFDVYWHIGLNVTISIFSFLLMAHLCYEAIIGHQEDLLEQRRRIRIWFVIAVALVVISSVLAERITSALGAYENSSIWITYVFSFFIVAWALLWLARLHPEVLAFAAGEPVVKIRANLNSHDQAVFEKLVKLMENQRLFTNHGLVIADLASQVGVPSHQLRKLINQTMGHRNFSSFLNSYRIADVKEALANPENEKTPILTLAMEAGFSSLAPFNRAFKAIEGITPSDFKLQTVSQSTENSVQN